LRHFNTPPKRGIAKTSLIGTIEHLQADDFGIWAEAQLDMHQHYAQAVLALVEQGALHWSSGSIAHLVQVADDGHITRWPLIEGSLTPTPAEPRLTDVRTLVPQDDGALTYANALKSAYETLGIRADWMPPQHPRNLSQTLSQGDAMPTNPTPTIPARDDAPDMPQVPQQMPLPFGNTAQAYPSNIKRLPVNDGRARISVASEYDHLTADDMLHGYMLMRSSRRFAGVSPRYANALAHKIQQAGIQPNAIKADELSYSTQTGWGDEWVPDLWSAQIWEKVRQDNVVLPLFRAIDMPSNPFELPVEGTDPTVYYVSETQHESQLTLGAGNPIPDSKIGSGKVPLHAKKLALRVGFSSELVEDSILPVLAIYRQQAQNAIAEALDNVLLNGDTATTATGNINSDHTTPTSGSAFLALDGLRKLPIVTDTDRAVDMGNLAPTLAKLRQARFRMPTRYSARPDNLAWVVDGGTYASLLNLSEFLTMDKAGALATAQTGQIGFLDGIPVFVSSAMPLTEADGKVGATTNERGTALCVYRGGWFVGYRRKIAVNVEYIPYTDSYQLTATVRLAFARRGDDTASALYNIAV
jgi:HK97 family phage major capsid protein